ncbi:MAG: hypothetical protein IMZ55_04425, partial [Acidobacteria bacterium]|nr:hypothetical protein [Acidobacteriota bacterium]
MAGDRRSPGPHRLAKGRDPYGEWLGFFVAWEGRPKKVALSGGAPVVMCEAPEELTKPLADRGEKTHRLPDILPNGKGVIFTIGTHDMMTSEQVHDVINAKTPAYPAAAWPEVTFTDSLTLHFNGDEVEAMHIAGAHSDADALYRFRKANVIHTGDLFFSGGYPYIDIGNGGSIDGTIAAAERILSLIDERTKVIPGHGPLADRKRVEEYRAMLVEVRTRIAKLIKDGKT